MQLRFLIALALLSAVAPAAASEPLLLASSHKARPQASLLIELVNWRCIWNNRSTVSVEGEIKNISNYTLPKVAARIWVMDEEGKTIGSGDRFVEESPFAPEDVAGFRGQITLGEGSKRPRSCSIDFIDGDGTYLSWREASR